MRPRLRRVVRGVTHGVVAAAAAASLLGGCSQTGTGSTGGVRAALDSAQLAQNSLRAGSEAGAGDRGGDLTVLVAGDVATWDPQLMYDGAESFFAQRTFVRTLTTYGTGAHQRDLVGDLATSSGASPDHGRTWAFTLRPGIRWQDGSPVTCEDLRHGIARTFDRTTHIAGTNYASSLLDIPTALTAEGVEKPAYTGPADTAHQALFDRAVTCAGSVITFRLRTPELEFPRIVALPEFAPRKAASDSAEAKTSFAVLSTGPYRLDGAWKPGQGGTFVRNEHWDRASDPVRLALPDTIRVEAGLGEGAVIQRLLNQRDGDAAAVSWVRASPTLLNQAAATPALASRITTPYTGDVDYLALNMRSAVFASPVVRQAFSVATNRATYVTAEGGPAAGDPSWSVLSPVITDRGTQPAVKDPVAGDPAAAKRLLTQAGVTLPVRVRVVYAQSALADKAYAALGAGWERAGFEVAMTPVPPEEYYATIERPASATTFDVFRGVWRPDLPAASAVLPPLFDARINIDSSGPGQDVGYFSDPGTTAGIDAAAGTRDPRQRAAAWLGVDEQIRSKGAYIALSAARATYVHGADVTRYEDHAVAGIVDFATVAVR